MPLLPHNPVRVKRFLGALAALAGLFVVTTMVFLLTGGSFVSHAWTAILYTSFGVLLVAFAGYLLFA